MKILAFIFILTPILGFSQADEIITASARLERSRSFYFTMGNSASLGQTNYIGGTLLGIGLNKRLNRIFSIGGSLSYSTFRTNYAEFMTGKYFDPKWNNDQPNNFYYPSDQSEYFLVNLSGGDLKQLYFSIPIKLNLIPIKSSTVASVFGTIAPGIVNSQLETILANENYFIHPSETEYLQENNISYKPSEKSSTLTGYLSVQAGVEFFPASIFSFFLQAGLGYSFKLPYVDTSLYQTHTIQEYRNDSFPLSRDKGFSTLNFQLGLCYNF